MVTLSGSLTGSLGKNTDPPQITCPRLLRPVQDPWQARPQVTQTVQHSRHLEIFHHCTFGLGFAK